MLAEAGIGGGRGPALDLRGEGEEGAEGGAADREEAGEAAEDVVVGGRGEVAARGAEAGGVEAGLVDMQEGAAAVEAAGGRVAVADERGEVAVGVRKVVASSLRAG